MASPTIFYLPHGACSSQAGSASPAFAMLTALLLGPAYVLSPMRPSGTSSRCRIVAAEATCDVMVVGAGVPKRGMGRYHAKQILDGDTPGLRNRLTRRPTQRRWVRRLCSVTLCRTAPRDRRSPSPSMTRVSTGVPGGILFKNRDLNKIVRFISK